MASNSCRIPATAPGITITDNFEGMPVEVLPLVANWEFKDCEVVYSIPEGETCEVLQIDFCLAGKYIKGKRCDYAFSTTHYLYIGEMKFNLTPSVGPRIQRKITDNLRNAAAQLRSSYEGIPELRDPVKKVVFLIHFPEILRPVLSDYLATKYPRRKDKIEDLDYLLENFGRVRTDNYVEV